MSENAATAEREKVSILVVDDRPENIFAMRSILSQPDYEIIDAPSGSEALKPLLKHDFAVILLDVLMPGMDGFETARLIRQREASRHIPIIFLTAAGNDMSMIHRGYSSGAVDYLLKPVDADIVKAKVGVFVDLYRKTQQLKRQEQQLREADRLKSELALEESEAEFAATFEQAPSGIAHAATDGRWLRVNKPFCDLIARTPEEVLGKRLQDFVAAEEVPEIVGALRKLIEGGGPIHWPERRVLRADGADAWISASFSLLRDPSGKPKKIIVVAEDITEKRRAAEAQHVLAEASKVLLRSFEDRKNLTDALRMALPLIGDSATLSLVPPTGGPATYVHLESSDPSVEPKSEPPPEIREGIVQTLSSAQPLLQPLRTSGPRSLLVVPLLARGQTLGALAFAYDESVVRHGPKDLVFAEDLAHRAAFAVENARLYQESQQAVIARDEFLSIASHELRTPLTPLLLQLQSLQRPPIDGGEAPVMDQAQVHRTVQRAEKQVHRLTALVENLLDVSRIRAGQLKLHPQEVDLSELTKDVAARFSEQLSRAGSTLALEMQGPVTGCWDRLRMEQVVTNLLSNAIKYGNGGPIELRVEAFDEAARLLIRDRGIGIPADKRSSIFERFGRAVSVRSYGGLGLGLYITRQILDAHGGSIEVDSEPGEGSTFTVLLPRRSEGPP